LRSPFIQSSTSALLLKPAISLGSAPGYSATTVQSSSELRIGLKVTFVFAMRFEVVQTRGHVENGKIGHYQVTLKIGFKLEA
jgi:dodecin